MMSLKSSVAMGAVSITSCGVVPNNAEMVGAVGGLGHWEAHGVPISESVLYRYLRAKLLYGVGSMG